MRIVGLSVCVVLTKDFQESIDSIIYQGRWFNLEDNEIVVGLSIAYDLGVSTFDAIIQHIFMLLELEKVRCFQKGCFKICCFWSLCFNDELDNTFVFADIDLVKDL